MASAATKLSSQSPPFNPNRILARDQSRSPVQSSSAYGSRSRSTSPYQDHPNNNPGRGVVTPGGVRRRMKYPVNPNTTHSNAIAKHTFEHNG